MDDDDEEEDRRVIRKLRRDIAKEREATKSLRGSINQWRNIVRDILSVNIESEHEEHEWRIRYQYQHSYNEMLKQRVRDLRSEVRLLRTGKGDIGPNFNGGLRRMTLTECKIQIRHLETDLMSTKSLRAMYDRQLDHESVQYAKIRERRSAIIREIFFLQKATLRQQEKFEKDYFAKLRKKYGGDLFRPSKMHVRAPHVEIEKFRPSQAAIFKNGKKEAAGDMTVGQMEKQQTFSGHPTNDAGDADDEDDAD